MSESSWVVGGGTLTSIVVAPDASTASAPVKEGGGETIPEDASLGRVGSTLKWAALYLRKVAPMGVTTWTGSPEGKIARPRNNKILWTKIGWISACPMAELLWGGTSAPAPAALDASAASAPVEEGGERTTPEDAPLGRVGLTLKWAVLYLRKVASMGATTWTGSLEGKIARPRNNKILWIKIGWISTCPTAELLWTLFKEWRNRCEKLIDAPDTKAYKNTYCSWGMV